MVAIAIAGFDYLVDMHTHRSGGAEPELFLREPLYCMRRGRRTSTHSTWLMATLTTMKDSLREVAIAKQLGFNGKSLIHPKQIEPLHKAYAPSETEVAQAKRVIAAADEAHRKGLGWCRSTAR